MSCQKVFGLTDKMIEKAVLNVLSEIRLEEYVPDEFLKKYDLMCLDSAVRNIHFPENDELLAKARRRLVFDEFFLFLLTQRLNASEETKVKNSLGPFDISVSSDIKSALPYQLTNGQ